MSHVLLWRPFEAAGPILPYRIARLGAVEGTVLQAAGIEDALAGVAGRGGAKQGECVEIAREGIAEVEYGAHVPIGAPITADADGRATPLSGAGIHQFVTDGEPADTDIAVAGIKLTDLLVGAVTITPDTAGVSNANASIVDDGKIQIRTSTTGTRVLVTWRRVEHVVGTAEVAGNQGDIGLVHLGLAVY